jgi:glycerophosphoryl diester phosphodiesterase
MFTRTKVWGHRGCRGPSYPPENSLAAFESAIKQGADGVELDVFLTEDNHLVVFHDDTLQRMTNGHGAITSFALAKLRNLRLKDPSGRILEATIPTLDEVLDVVDQFRRRHPEDRRARDFVVNIEIKGAGIAKHVAQSVKRRFEQGWTPHNFQVSSFDMNSLREMKQVQPGIPVGALIASGEAPWDIEEPRLAERLAAIPDVRPTTVNLTLPSLTHEAVQIIRRAGAMPVAWTYNERDPDHLEPGERREVAGQLLSNEIVTIITDFPEAMRRLLEVAH